MPYNSRAYDVVANYTDKDRSDGLFVKLLVTGIFLPYEEAGWDWDMPPREGSVKDLDVFVLGYDSTATACSHGDLDKIKLSHLRNEYKRRLSGDYSFRKTMEGILLNKATNG